MVGARDIVRKCQEQRHIFLYPRKCCVLPARIERNEQVLKAAGIAGTDVESDVAYTITSN